MISTLRSLKNGVWELFPRIGISDEGMGHVSSICSSEPFWYFLVMGKALSAGYVCCFSILCLCLPCSERSVLLGFWDVKNIYRSGDSRRSTPFDPHLMNLPTKATTRPVLLTFTSFSPVPCGVPKQRVKYDAKSLKKKMYFSTKQSIFHFLVGNFQLRLQYCFTVQRWCRVKDTMVEGPILETLQGKSPSESRFGSERFLPLGIIRWLESFLSNKIQQFLGFFKAGLLPSNPLGGSYEVPEFDILMWLTELKVIDCECQIKSPKGGGCTVLGIYTGIDPNYPY